MATYLIGFAGQSNADRHFRSEFSNLDGRTSAEAFEDNLETLLGEPSGDVTTVDTAIGNSAASSTAVRDDGQDFWWNTETNSPGPLLLDAVAELQAQELATGTPVSAIIWSQGERDSITIGTAEQSVEDYIAATTNIFNYFRTELGQPDLPIFIQQTGDISRTDVVPGGGIVRGAQAEIAENDPNTFLGAVTYDIEKEDTLHFTNEGFHEVADRLSDSVATVLNERNELGLSLSEDGTGPQITGAEVVAEGREIVVSVDTGDAGSLAGIGDSTVDGFVVLANEALIEPTGVVIESANTIRLTFEKPLFGEVVVSYALETTGGTGGTTGFHTDDDTIFDTAGLPLEPGFVTATGEAATAGTPIRLEAEDFTLDGLTTEAITPIEGIPSGGEVIRFPFEVDGATIVDGETGSASTTFTGDAGSYALTVAYFDERDGESTFTVLVNGQPVSTVNMDRGFGGEGAQLAGYVRTVLDSSIPLQPGDVISIEAEYDFAEFVRLDYVELTPVESVENAAPVAADDSLTVPADGALTEGDLFADNGSGLDRDPDLDTFTVTSANGTAIAGATVVTVTSAGGREAALTISPDGSLSFTPGEAFSDLGTEDTDTVTFDYEITDAEGNTDTATTTITVTGEPTPILGDPLRIEFENTDLEGLDVEDRSFASGAEVTSIPIGSEDGSTGTATFNFNGESGTYNIDLRYFDENDGVGQISVSVNGTEIDSFLLDEDTGLAGPDTGSARDRSVATSLELNTGDEIVVTATQGGFEFVRMDFIEFTPVITQIIPENEAPDANADAFTLEDGESLSGANLLADNGGGADTDPENDIITVTSVNGTAISGATPVSVSSAGGTTTTVTVSEDGTIDFDPATDFDLAPNETDTITFSYELTDIAGNTDTSSVTITLNGPEPTPTGDPIRIEAEDMTLSNYIAEGADFASGGELTHVGFDTLDGGTGTASFTFTGGSGQYQIVLRYHDESDGVGSIAVAQNGNELSSFTLDGGDGTPVASAGNGVDGTVANLVQVNTGDEFVITGTVGGAEFARLDYIEFVPLSEIEDLPPIAADDSFALAVDGSLSGENLLADNGNGADSDPESGTLTVTAANGTAIAGATPVSVTTDAGRSTTLTIGPDGALSFDPGAEFDDLAPEASDSLTFTYELTDEEGNTDEASVTITINGLDNQAPVAADDAFTVAESGSLSGENLLSDNGNGPDSDADGSDLTITQVNGASFTGSTTATITSAGGRDASVTIGEDGALSFTPDAAFEDLNDGQSDTLTFSYTLEDANGDTDTASVTITVNGEGTEEPDEPDVPTTPGEGFRVEAEDMSFSFLTVANTSAASGGQAVGVPILSSNSAAGSIFYTFEGASGVYDLNLGVFDESDGNGQIRVFVEGQEIADFRLNEPGGSTGLTASSFREVQVGDDIALETGDVIQILTQRNQWEYSYVDYLDFISNDVPDTNAPVAANDAFTIDSDGSLTGENLFADNGNGADSDAEGGTLTVVAVNGSTITGSSGTGVESAGGRSALVTVGTDGSIAYTPDSDFDDLAVGETDTVTITYTVADEAGNTDEATVTITVNGTNEVLPPVQGDTLRVEAEDMSLNGLETEVLGFASGREVIRNDFGSAEGTGGTADFTFTGETGIYDIIVRYHDENDGVGTISLSQNGSLLDSWNPDADTGSGVANAFNGVDREVATGVTVTNGDSFSLEALVGGGEYNRIDYVDFVQVETLGGTGNEGGDETPPAEEPGPIEPTPTETLRIEAEAMALDNMLTEGADFASGDTLIRNDFATPEGESGSASFTFSGVSGLYDLIVRYHDESDGVSTITVSQNGSALNSLTLDGGDGSGRATADNGVDGVIASSLQVDDGDLFSIEAMVGGAEYNRIDYVEFRPASAEASALTASFSVSPFIEDENPLDPNGLLGETNNDLL